MVKHIPPQAPSPMTFEQLVQHAKTSDVGLGPADVERLLQRLQTRVQLEGVPLPNTSGPNTAPPGAPRATRHGKLAKTGLGKSLVGGLGLLAAAALYYNTRTPASQPDAGTPVVDGAGPTADPSIATTIEAPALRATTSLGAEPRDVTREPRVDDHPTSNRGVVARRTPARLPTARSTSVAQEPPIATEPIAKVAPAPSVSKPPAPTLDSSLQQLERAERELRSGNPSAALTVLAAPVSPSLSSRAEALRAVALCQSGKRAAGTKLAQQHLGRNPSSPYEKRLQSACDKDL